MLKLSLPLRLGRGQNDRGHPLTQARRAKKQREAIAWVLNGKKAPALPVVVTMTRVAPSKGLDSDNLVGSAKHVRDQIAQWLGVDDADARVQWKCEQRRGEWATEIEVAGVS